ncbi:SPOR domain-containing protein [Tannerella sp.]|uniref:SPOR domain-containing protein n=1 Tax=Tannerella sp. TaxID=2382127 RepID=UPI0026DD805E|nr:SPOR domain-containing protein [Tannerella sp.]MDO4703973.1 SPOR domain-containing protein [Tannerella sp.]
MKRYVFILGLLCCGGSMLTAQDSIVDALTRNVPGRGTVTIHQSPAIRQMIGRPVASDRIEEANGRKFLLSAGYRIQIFSGNDQRSSKGEAFGKEQQIKNQFSDVPTYVSYTAPFWRLRVGDYVSYEEAYRMMQKLVGAFPSFRKEMFITKEEIRIPVR